MSISDSRNLALHCTLFPLIREYQYSCVTSLKVPQEEGTPYRKKWNKSQCGRKVAVKERAEKNHRAIASR